MTSKKFIKIVEKSIKKYVREYYGDYANLEVHLVWYCKTIQNWKAIAITNLGDGIIYECTLNGDKDQMYIDVYKKINKVYADLT